MATAIRQKSAPAPALSASSPAGFRSEADFCEVIEAALSELDSDERSGPLVRATRLRMRLELPDISAVVNIAVGDAGAGNLRWGFSDDGEWDSKLRFSMDSEVANRFLQGRESLAIAIVRGRVRCEGEARYTLLYVPALRLLVEPYRHAVRRHRPELVLD